MSALPKGWTLADPSTLRHVCGVCVDAPKAPFTTFPDTGEHPTLDAAIAALEPHVEAWRAAVREAVGQTVSAPVAAAPVVAERDPLVDPAIGDVLAMTCDGVASVLYVQHVEDRVVTVRDWTISPTSEVSTWSMGLATWREWEDWTVTVVLRGAP